MSTVYLAMLPFLSRRPAVRKTLSLFAIFALGCGDKTPPEPAAAEPDPAPVVAEPEPEPEPPPPPPPPEPNADINVTFTFTDGSSKSGHVKRIERSTDWFAEKGWEDSDNKLTVELEGAGTLIESSWSEIASVTVLPGKVPGDVDCTYSSEYTPWMYTCELRSPTKAKTTDGKAWTVNTRHKWLFTFDDDSTVEFYMVKYPTRMQDSERVSLDDDQGENYDMYSQLQDQLRLDAKSTSMVKSIKITAP